jgi:Tfp pilus assembly protein PilO
VNHLGPREFIFLALLFAVPAGVYFLVFQPRSQARQAMTEDIELKREQLNELRLARGQAASNLAEQITQYKQALEVARDRQPALEGNARILGAYKRLAESNQILSSIDNEPPPAVGSEGPTPIQEKYTIRRVKMNLSGNFDNFYAFLLQVEDQPRLTQIETLSISREGRQREGLVNANMVLTIYYLKDKSN